MQLNNLTDFLNLITSKHRTKPKYIQMVSAVVQAFIDTRDQTELFSREYDLDYAIGVQLDAVGEWAGRSRYIEVPLSVYFSLDTPGLGFDEGIWYAPFDPVEGLVRLDDVYYRTLLRAQIIANNWDGNPDGVYAAYNALFSTTGDHVLFSDYGRMETSVALFGTNYDPLWVGLFATFQFYLRPVGQTLWHLTQAPADIGQPYFALDCEDTGVCAGFDIGAWGQIHGPR